MREIMSLVWRSRGGDEEVRAVFVMDDLFMVRFRLAGDIWSELGRAIVAREHFKELGMAPWQEEKRDAT
jgi:hypothetical protein